LRLTDTRDRKPLARYGAVGSALRERLASTSAAVLGNISDEATTPTYGNIFECGNTCSHRDCRGAPLLLGVDAVNNLCAPSGDAMYRWPVAPHHSML
jgi:hypothetical protein